MTATEELRARLNARGIHWERNETLDIVGRDIATVYRANHAEWIAFEDTDVDLNPTGNGINVTNYRKPLTPEQAIEATLGRGMLTADDVRDLIERHSDSSGGNGRDFYNGVYVAIADELNATLGSCNCSNSEQTGTCHNVDIGAGGYFKCSECGASCSVDWERSGWGEPRFCPNCGRKVVEQ